MLLLDDFPAWPAGVLQGGDAEPHGWDKRPPQHLRAALWPMPFGMLPLPPAALQIMLK